MADDNPFIPMFLGQDLGDYRLVELLSARGGFSLVFRAVHVSGDEFAVKVLRPNSTAEDELEFRREGRLLASLQRSRGVVDLIDSAEQVVTVMAPGDIPIPLTVRYHVLELAQGNLEDVVEHRGEVEWPERLRLLRGSILGVHQMHLASIAHRDLKSANCLLFLRPKKVTDCRISDLGRSRNWQEAPAFSVESYFQGRGDFRFAGPELLLGQGLDVGYSHRLGDLYGLGSLFFELGTGVGITQFVLNLGPDDIRSAISDAKLGLAIDLSVFRPAYDEAIERFATTVPAQIRVEAVKLISQLCDPTPALRLPKSGPGSKRPNDSGLDWLLRRTDIMLRRLEIQPERSRKLLTSQGV